MDTTFNETIQPLGRLRLRIVEFIKQLISLNNSAILSYLIDSDILSDITDLITAYPWNNFLQLLVINIYQDILENSEDPEVKQAALN